MITPLLSTKLIIPHPSNTLVSRPHLIERLNQATNGKLTLLSAASGYGKTTLLSQWLSSQNHPVAWLTLDTNDNHPIPFLRYLIAALQTIQPDLAQNALNLLISPEPRPTEFILTDIINELHQHDTQIILVLDDYHTIHNNNIHTALTFLLDYAPPQLHLIVATRHDPPFSLSKLRGRGEILELSDTDLRFSPHEIKYFFDHCRAIDTKSLKIEAIDQHLEGWITGYQLLALSSPQNTISDFSHLNGNHPYILEYLAEEVLNTLPQNLKQFLLSTSILDQFCPDLCAALTDNENSFEHIQQLQSRNLFILPVDTGNMWFRYHSLFREFLHQRLIKSYPDSIPQLHQNAAQWFEQNRFKLQAIDHALKASDYQTAIRILEPELHFIWVRTEMPTILGWLEALPSEILHSKPQLCLTYAWGLTFADNYEHIEYYLKIAQNLLDDILKTQSPDPYILDMLGQAEALEIHLLAHNGHHQTAIDHCLETSASLKTDQRFLHAVLHQRLGTYYLALDQLPDAYTAFDIASQAFEKMNNTCETLISLNYLGNTQLQLGKLQNAESTFQHLLETSQLWDGAMLSVTAEATLRLSQIYLDWKQIELAQNHAQQAIASSTASGNTNLKIESLLQLAHIQHISGNLDSALQHLESALKFPNIQDHSQLFVNNGSSIINLLQTAVIHNLQRDIALNILATIEPIPTLNSSNSPSPTNPLTQREHDVLQLVAAGLSNRAISETLVVTVGTTKKHLNNIFSKLNVTSRTQAVARAKELNLL